MRLLVALVMALCAISAQAKSIQFELNHKQSERSVEVNLHFQASSDTTTIIKIPQTWGGQEELYRVLSNIEILSPNAKITGLNNQSLTVSHQPKQNLHLRYQVKPDYEGLPNSDLYYRPIIFEDYFHLIGNTFLLRPANYLEGEHDFEIRLRNQGAHFASSHGVGEAHRFHGTFSKFRHAIFYGGKITITPIDVAGKPVYTAYYGTWNFDLDQFNELVKTIIKSQRDFFNDHSYPFYLITLTPVEMSPRSKGGTGLTNSFALFLPKDAPADSLDGFKFLLAHEHFHNWNGRVIGREEPEELVYWFSEGFTNHFTLRLGVREGLLTIADFLRFFNERLLQRYHLSPARNQTNQDVLREFWTDRYLGKLPYQRGDLLAYLWNYRIKKNNQGHSIDDFMIQLYREARASGTVVSKENVDRIFQNYLPGGVAADVEFYVEQGNTVILPDDLLGECFFKDKAQDAESGEEYPQFHLKPEYVFNAPALCLEFFR